MLDLTKQQTADLLKKHGGEIHGNPDLPYYKALAFTYKDKVIKESWSCGTFLDKDRAIDCADSCVKVASSTSKLVRSLIKSGNSIEDVIKQVKLLTDIDISSPIWKAGEFYLDSSFISIFDSSMSLQFCILNGNQSA